MFLARENELDELNYRYDRGEFECMIIYGRRRVGKTALINEFCKDRKVIYFPALKDTVQGNLDILSQAINTYKDPDSHVSVSYNSFQDAFTEIGRIAERERVIFVIDEYPYLAKADLTISSRLQHLIDLSWSKGKMFLILCGSSVSFMEEEVLSYESPLYGRRTGQFKIEPLNYRETAVFHPELPAADNALIYGITGGVPHYINKLDVKTNIDTALMENLFDRSSYLYEEPGNLLKQELREPTIYNAIIKAIADGSSRLNDITTKVGEDTSVISKYLKTLMDLGIVTKEIPITEKPGKKTIYLLEDNFFRFWYRFVPINSNAIDSGRMEKIYPKAVKQNFSDYMGLTFEKMCKDYLLYYAESLPIELRQIGKWWGTDSRRKKQIQIDIVGTPVNGQEYLIGSCKYRNEKIGLDELTLLQEYASVFGKGSKYHYFIFSKGGFTDNLLQAQEQGKVTLITLEDMYRK